MRPRSAYSIAIHLWLPCFSSPLKPEKRKPNFKLLPASIISDLPVGHGYPFWYCYCCISEVSVIVGTLWEDLPEEKKEIFRAEARRLKEEHMVSSLAFLILVLSLSQM